MSLDNANRRGGKKGRKRGRNFRAYGSEAIMKETRYRAAHGIPSGSRKENHRTERCPLHRGRKQMIG
jgi:hypothetical protein